MPASTQLIKTDSYDHVHGLSGLGASATSDLSFIARHKAESLA